MSGFSPDWLALREPVDHRSRDDALAVRLGAHFDDREAISVVDLGCGTGSNLRGTYRYLPAAQSWTLVDYDARLLAAARETLAGWAEASRVEGDGLRLEQDGKILSVTFRQADLNAALGQALGAKPDIVTASAFFDLCSPEFIGRLVSAVAERKAVFFTVLTYNGEQEWTPAHAADSRMLRAFTAHQAGDKGFGASAGPAAPAALGATLQSAGYDVHEADTPWRLGASDVKLIKDLADGFAAAVAETGSVPADVIESWSAITRTGAVVGHTDTLAIPATC
jgi:SAM-dependent methyltransferase